MGMSNQELQVKITDLSGKLGVSPDTSGNNGQLLARYNGLLAKLEAANKDGEGAGTTPPPVEPVNPVAGVTPAANTGGIPDADNASADAAGKKDDVTDTDTADAPQYVVVQGKAITTRRGILHDGMGIEEKDFINVESWQAAVDRGDVVESK